MKSEGLDYTDAVPFPGKWRQRAACQDTPVQWFFAVSTSGRHARINPLIHKAKAVCRGCCVRDECLAYSLENKVYGIWGGLTESERAQYRKALRAS